MNESKLSTVAASSMSLDECVNALGIKSEQKGRKRGNRKHNQTFEPMVIPFDATVPDASSQQWRLLDPNRPVGMAPLVPSNARQNTHNFYRNNHNRQRRNFNNSYADRDIPSSSVGVNRRNNGIFKNNHRPNAANAMCTALMPVGPVQNNPTMTMNQLSSLAGIVAPMMNGSTYDNLFSKIMEKWEGSRKQQKYDMGVQKEISQIQGKTLYFSCSSGGPQTVVSSDGYGVDDCTVNVATTNTSMHQRFA